MPSNPIMSSCSNAAILEAFDRVKAKYIPHGRWIGEKNYYLRNTIARIDNKSASDLKRNQIEEYIASSIVLHCFDGWSYLSRSVESLISGDIASSIHFAYYAELRSAMSLMANEGVGIFNQTHIWFNASKTIAVTPYRRFSTHLAVDSGMTEWSKLANKKDVIFDIIKVNNHLLSDWIRETGFSSRSKYSTSIINHWLKKWSIDLHLKEDQYLRNEMSYRPHFVPSTINIPDLIDKLTEIWKFLEPTENNRFPLLDKHMLRVALAEVYRKVKGQKPIGTDYEKFIKNIFDRLGEDTTQSLFRFLLQDIELNEPYLFKEAKGDSNISTNKNNPLPIICRAILMLRLASGVADQMIKNSGILPSSLNFWWEPLALKLGFISQIPSGISCVDLYSDIRDCIEEISDTPSSSYNNLNNASRNIARPIFFYKQFERSGIWGLGL